MSSRSPSSQDARKGLDHELAQAEARGAERVRDQLRRVLDEGRRIVRLGEQQIEVVEVASLTEVLDEDLG